MSKTEIINEKLTMESIDEANAMIRQLKKQLREVRMETKRIVAALHGRNELKFWKHKMVLRKMTYEHGNAVKCLIVENTKLEKEQKIATKQIQELTKACETLVFDECRMHDECEELEKQISNLKVTATTIVGNYGKASEGTEAIAADQPSFASTMKTTVMNRKRKKPKEVSGLRG